MINKTEIANTKKIAASVDVFKKRSEIIKKRLAEIDEEYRKLAEEKKAELNKELEVCTSVISFYDQPVSEPDEKVVDETAAEEIDGDVIAEAEVEVQDEEPASAEEPSFQEEEEENDADTVEAVPEGEVEELPQEEDEPVVAEEEIEDEAVPVDDSDPAEEGWATMPEEWKD